MTTITPLFIGVAVALAAFFLAFWIRRKWNSPGHHQQLRDASNAIPPPALPTENTGASSDGSTAVPTWFNGWPRSIAFFDVETTGITPSDRVVSLAIIAMKTDQLPDGNFDLEVAHIVCNPQQASHPAARRVHRYPDRLLHHQETFAENSNSIRPLFTRADLLVGHNVTFDLEFMYLRVLAARPFTSNEPYLLHDGTLSSKWWHWAGDAGQRRSDHWACASWQTTRCLRRHTGSPR